MPVMCRKCSCFANTRIASLHIPWKIHGLHIITSHHYSCNGCVSTESHALPMATAFFSKYNAATRDIIFGLCEPSNRAALVPLLPIKPHVVDRKRRRQGIRLRERPSQCWGCLWVWSCQCDLLKGTSGGLVRDKRKLSEDEPTYLKDQLCFIQVVIMIFDMYRSLLLCGAHGAKSSCVAWRFLVGMFHLSRWWGQHRPSSHFYWSPAWRVEGLIGVIYMGMMTTATTSPKSPSQCGWGLMKTSITAWSWLGHWSLPSYSTLLSICSWARTAWKAS